MAQTVGVMRAVIPAVARAVDQMVVRNQSLPM